MSDFIINDAAAHATSVKGQYTCNTCGIKFTNLASQKFHMKSEWHRYNLKRRVVGLPTITSEAFVESVAKNLINVNGFKVTSNIVNNVKNSSSVDTEDVFEDEYGFTIHKKKKKPEGVRQLTKKDMKRMAKFNNGRNNRFNANSVQFLDAGRGISPSGVSVTSEFSHFSLGESVNSAMIHTETDSNADLRSYNEEMGDLDASLESSFIYVSISDAESPESTGYSEDQALETEDEDSLENYDVISANACIYCNLQNKTLEELLDHMHHSHGFYIPDKKYLLDVEGLIRFLWNVISLDYECLSCTFIGRSIESIQDHMISKGHCRIPYESKDDRSLFSPFYNYVQREESLSLDEVTDVDEPLETDATGVELTLPSGYKIGHKSMMRYYRQNPRLDAQPRESSVTTVTLADQRINLGGLTKVQHEKSFKEMLQTHRKELTKQERKSLNNYRRANYQPHFRNTTL